MRLDKVIVRAVLSTLAAIVLLFGCLLLALCFLYPSTMMTITYDLGMDKACVKYAMRAYNRSDEVYYAAYATEVAIGADLDEKIEECGLAFMDNADFEEYCTARDERMQLPAGLTGQYAQYIYGQVSLAQYRQGEVDGAINTAFDALKENSFPKNNAVEGLALTALMKKDSAAAKKIEEKMMRIESGLSGEDKTNFDALLLLLKK